MSADVNPTEPTVQGQTTTKLFPANMSGVQFNDIWAKIKDISPLHRAVLEAIENDDIESKIMTGRGRLNKSGVIKKLGITSKELTQVLDDAREFLGDDPD